MGAWDAWIGRTEVRHDRLPPALLDRFCATIDRPTGGEIVPQAVHWVLCTPDAATEDLGVDGHPLRSDDPGCFFPPLPLPRRMWASSTVSFFAPLALNADIVRTSTITAVTEKTGSSGPLAFVDVAHETHADGTLCVKETQTLVYRAATAAKPSAPPAAVNVDLSGWNFHRTFEPSETLLFRFSAITFNSHRIHYDLPYARDVEGYRGLVVHGPLMATLLLDLVAQEFGQNWLKHFAFRAQAPAFAGEPLHLVGRTDQDRIELAALGPDGTVRLSATGSS